MRLAFGLMTSLPWLVLSPFPSVSGPNVLSNEWSVTLHGGSDSAPAVGPDGTIYFGTFAGRLWALTPDGTRKWIFRADNEIKSAPAVSPDSTVYFGCRDRKVYAVRANGKKRWEFPTGGWVDSSPALASDGTIYFGSWDKSFYALNADGKKQWQFSTPGEIVSSPAIGADGTIYFGSHDKKFYALTAKGAKTSNRVPNHPVGGVGGQQAFALCAYPLLLMSGERGCSSAGPFPRGTGRGEVSRPLAAEQGDRPARSFPGARTFETLDKARIVGCSVSTLSAAARRSAARRPKSGCLPKSQHRDSGGYPPPPFA